MAADPQEFDGADGKRYRVHKLPAIEQLVMFKKVIPLVGKLMPLFREANAGSDKLLNEEEKAEQAATRAKVFESAAHVIAEVKDEDLRWLTNTALSICDRQVDGGNWVPVWNKQAQRIMMDDIELWTLLGITVVALEFNLGNSSAALSDLGKSRLSTAA